MLPTPATFVTTSVPALSREAPAVIFFAPFTLSTNEDAAVKLRAPPTASTRAAATELCVPSPAVSTIAPPTVCVKAPCTTVFDWLHWSP